MPPTVSTSATARVKPLAIKFLHKDVGIDWVRKTVDHEPNFTPPDTVSARTRAQIVLLLLDEFVVSAGHEIRRYRHLIWPSTIDRRRRHLALASHSLTEQIKNIESSQTPLDNLSSMSTIRARVVGECRRRKVWPGYRTDLARTQSNVWRPHHICHWDRHCRLCSSCLRRAFGTHETCLFEIRDGRNGQRIAGSDGRGPFASPSAKLPTGTGGKAGEDSRDDFIHCRNRGAYRAGKPAELLRDRSPLRMS